MSSKGKPADVCGWVADTRGRREVRRGQSVGAIGVVGRREERRQQVFCGRTKEETEGWSLGEHRERRASTGSLLGFVGLFVCYLFCDTLYQIHNICLLATSS